MNVDAPVTAMTQSPFAPVLVWCPMICTVSPEVYPCGAEVVMAIGLALVELEIATGAGAVAWGMVPSGL